MAGLDLMFSDPIINYLLGLVVSLLILEKVAKPIFGKIFDDGYDAAKKALAPSVGNVLSKLDDKIKILSYLDEAINVEEGLTDRERLIVREAVLEAFSLKVNVYKELTENKVDK
jgi:hypothetical protein